MDAMKKFGYTILKICNNHSYQRIWWEWNRAVHWDFDFRWQGISSLPMLRDPSGLFSKFDLADYTDILKDRNCFIWIPRPRWL